MEGTTQSCSLCPFLPTPPPTRHPRRTHTCARILAQTWLVKSSKIKDGIVLNHPRSPERLGNHLHSKSHHLRPLLSGEKLVWEMLQSSAVSLGAYLQCRFFWAFTSSFCLQSNQLLSVLPAGLIGFVFSVVCFWGYPPPEQVPDRDFFFSSPNFYQDPYQSPKLKWSILAWLEER